MRPLDDAPPSDACRLCNDSFPLSEYARKGGGAVPAMKLRIAGSGERKGGPPSFATSRVALPDHSAARCRLSVGPGWGPYVSVFLASMASLASELAPSPRFGGWCLTARQHLESPQRGVPVTVSLDTLCPKRFMLTRSEKHRPRRNAGHHKPLVAKVPELTRGAGVNLNAQVSLRAASKILLSPQSSGFWPTVLIGHRRT
jgi:hypothetical protein